MAPPQSDSLGVFPATAPPPPLEEDMERILWTEAEIAARVEELASEISRDLKGSAVPVAVVGVATGAFLFLADVVRRIALPVTVDFVRVESYGSSTESSGAPRISSDVKVDVEGKHVILVEDIVDTGNTLSCLIPHMKSKGARSVSVCTFLDKPVRRKVHVELVGDGKFYRGFEQIDSVHAVSLPRATNALNFCHSDSCSLPAEKMIEYNGRREKEGMKNIIAAQNLPPLDCLPSDLKDWSECGEVLEYNNRQEEEGMKNVIPAQNLPLLDCFPRVSDFKDWSECGEVLMRVSDHLNAHSMFGRARKCPDYFVVGYGMDFAEIYRNLPFIGVLKPEKYKL